MDTQNKTSMNVIMISYHFWRTKLLAKWYNLFVNTMHGLKLYGQIRYVEYFFLIIPISLINIKSYVYEFYFYLT